jgi:ribosomal protein S18 acetylase RimI-like enzyme
VNDEFQIVEAQLSDAHVFTEIQARTWLDSYPNDEAGISREDVAAKIQEWEQEGDSRIISEMQKPGSRAWVVKKNDEVIGFVAALKDEDERSIEALHILPEYQRKGLGSALLATALEWLGTDEKITIEVVTYNTDAQRLYEKFGFKNSGKSAGCIILPSGMGIEKIIMVNK